jgi:hypothetical protein
VKAKCPVCDKEVELEENAKAFLNVSKTVPWSWSHEELIEYVVHPRTWDNDSSWGIEIENRGKVHWACDQCLDRGEAILADTTQQTFGGNLCFYAYFDLVFKCCTCGDLFMFSAKEQHYWYEKLKFWANSYPKDCLSCRRKKREANKQIKK